MEADSDCDTADDMVLVALFISPGHGAVFYEWEWIEPEKLAWLKRTDPVVSLGGAHDGLDVRFLNLLDQEVTDVEHQRILKRYVRINGYRLGELPWEESEASTGDAAETEQ